LSLNVFTVCSIRGGRRFGEQPWPSLSFPSPVHCLRVKGDICGVLTIAPEPPEALASGEVMVDTYYISLSEGSLIHTRLRDDPEFGCIPGFRRRAGGAYGGPTAAASRRVEQGEAAVPVTLRLAFCLHPATVKPMAQSLIGHDA
jgi:hypothetical protein